MNRELIFWDSREVNGKAHVRKTWRAERYISYCGYVLDKAQHMGTDRQTVKQFARRKNACKDCTVAIGNV